MESYIYSNPVKLLSGEGQLDSLAGEIQPYGKRVLFVYGRNHIKEYRVYDRIAQSLQDADIGWIELGGVQPNPRAALVRKGIEICKSEGIDFVLGVGGGSTSDSVKAIGMGACVDYDIWDAYEDFHHLMHGAEGEYPHVPTGMLPIGVVMTKPGTGSEFDYTSVLSNRSTLEKLMVINKVMYPKFAIHDPALASTLPAQEISYGVADIMTHLFEQYFTLSQDTDILDRYKEAGLRTVIESGQRALKDPGDRAAQSYLLYVAAWACSDQSMCGAMGGWAAHMIEHEISAITDLNHGHGMAIVYIAWLKYVAHAIPHKLAQYGESVWGIERKGRSEADMATEAIERTAEFWSSLGIPLNLREAGIDTSIIQVAAKQAVRFGPLFSVVELGEQDVLKILEMAS
jgi:alcohol dehydrogenase YqhD (iron-dependent ADH family)